MLFLFNGMKRLTRHDSLDLSYKIFRFDFACLISIAIYSMTSSVLQSETFVISKK